MNKLQLINSLFFALGIASCLFVIFSISIRIVRNELQNINKNFIKEIKQGKIRAAHR